MISPVSFTADWIKSHRKEKRFSRVNPPVVEKMIRALALLEVLVVKDVKFVFKGGTALILMMPEPRRFSVDIDILTEHSRAELEAVFNKVIETKIFDRWTLDEERSYQRGISKAHYLFHFGSQFQKGPGYILLDVLFEKNSYPVVSQIPIKSSWISLEGESTLVTVPSIESILGDKLTAFAPNTTGVPYGRDKSLEIVKQLHDIGHLFDLVKDVTVVDLAFSAIVVQQIQYRNLEIKPEHVLDDIIATALLIGKTEKHHEEVDKPKYTEIRLGLDQFGSYLMTGNFYIDAAIESSAKAGYLAAKLKTRNLEPLEFGNDQQTDFQFESMPYNVLNRLRKTRNHSLFYWSKIAETLKIK